jgi:hypothetical protein
MYKICIIYISLPGKEKEKASDETKTNNCREIKKINA